MTDPESAVLEPSLLFGVPQDHYIGYKKTSSTCAHSTVKDPKWPLIIRKWKSFNLKTLKCMAKGQLFNSLMESFNHKKCPEHGRAKGDTFEARNDEDALQLLLGNTVAHDVNCMLEHTQERLSAQGLIDLTLKPGMRMEAGGQAEQIFGAKGNKYKPDWAGVLPVEPEPETSTYQADPPKTRLPGDTKLRWKVDFTVLNDLEEKNVVFPLMGLNDLLEETNYEVADNSFYETHFHGLRQAIIQIYTYCFETGCRYGYIVNETQLLVIRVRPQGELLPIDDPQDDMMETLRHQGLLEYKLIGYNRDDPEKLTVHIALWWLHILAGQNHKIQWSYTPLREMTLGLDDEDLVRNTGEGSVVTDLSQDDRIVENQPRCLKNRRPKPKRNSGTISGRVQKRASTKKASPRRQAGQKKRGKAVQTSLPYASSKSKAATGLKKDDGAMSLDVAQPLDDAIACDIESPDVSNFD